MLAAEKRLIDDDLWVVGARAGSLGVTVAWEATNGVLVAAGRRFERDRRVGGDD
jgi:hypothetical protein